MTTTPRDPGEQGQKPDNDPSQPGHSEDAPGQQKPRADQDLPEDAGEPAAADEPEPKGETSGSA